MTTLFAAMIGGWEMILILAVILIIFGPKKLPEFAKGLGQSIKEFKKASHDVVSEIENAANEEHRSVPAPRPAVEPAQTEARTASTTPAASHPASDHKA